MTDTVKVFKNTSGTPIVPGDMDAAIDYTVHTTSSSERAVIKDLEFTCGGNGMARVSPLTVELDGFPVVTGKDGVLAVEGSLIMNPSSTLKVKATPLSGYVGTSDYFKGMAFFESSSGRQFLTGNGANETSISPTLQSGSGHPSDDATGAVVFGTLHGGSASGTRFYYQLYNNQIKKYNEAGTNVHSWGYGSTGYGMCNDGVYIYRAASGSTTTIYRTKMSDQSESTIYTTGGSYNAPRANQGSCFTYHKGFIYSRDEASSTYVDKIRLSDMNCTRTNHSDFNLGSYSDGGFATTATDGTNYLVEAGTSSWFYYNIDTDIVTKISAGTQSSTEYGNGGTEIAPGIGLIFGEETDRATIINMNTKSMTTVQSNNPLHTYTTNYAYGNRIAFAGILGSVKDTSLQNFNYQVYASGVEQT
jgi:hypothetical protein